MVCRNHWRIQRGAQKARAPLFDRICEFGYEGQFCITMLQNKAQVTFMREHLIQSVISSVLAFCPSVTLNKRSYEGLAPP